MQIEYKFEDWNPVIYVYYRDPQTRLRKVKTYNDFRPYFYIAQDEISKLKYHPDVTDYEMGFIALSGEKATKVFVRSPSHVRKVREQFKKTYEADISYTSRFLIDCVRTIPDYPMRIFYFDIEVAAERSVPDVMQAPQPITAIATYDNFTKKFVTLVWRADQTVRKEERGENSIVLFYNKEEDLINAFIGLVQMYDPDILTGWNMVNFDMRYVISRGERLGISMSGLSPMGEIYNENNVRVKGRILFDLLVGYKRLLASPIDNLKLDTVARHELGLEKIKHSGTYKELWENDLDKLIDYNIRDIDITRQLDEKCKIVEFHNEIRKLSKCQFEDVQMNSKIIDSYILNKMYGIRVLPTLERNTKDKPIKGAIVLTPTKGLHENVLVFDMKSLYPSVIVSVNMSPETISADGDVRLGNGINFRSQPTGILPEILTELFEKRKKFRDEMKKHPFDSTEYEKFNKQQVAVKIIMNSIYGVLAYPRFRFYRPEIAESITWVGRQIITYSKKKAEELGYEVIYQDTDSCFIKGKGTTVDELVEEGNELRNKLNESYKEFADNLGIKKHIFELQFEKVYKTVFFKESKKRYSGLMVWKDGKPADVMQITGFDSIRTDNSLIAKKIQKKVLKMILNKQTREEIIEYLKEEIDKMKNMEYTFEEIGIPQGVTKNLDEYKTATATVRGVMYSNEHLNTSFVRGDKPRLLWIKSFPQGFPKTDVICFEHNEQVIKGFELDMDRMLERTIHMKIKPLFEGMDWEYGLDQVVIIGGYKNFKIGDYM